MSSRGLVVIANRLPVVRAGNSWQTSPGGLVTALSAVLDGDEQAAWIGWLGGDVPDGPFTHDNITHHPIELSEEDLKLYYEGMANRTFWPLYHDAVRPPEYHRRWWNRYWEVNARFARRAAEVTPQGGTAWVHDYHLQLVPGLLRKLRPDVRITFFLHIPFPPTELFAQLPWRKEILEGLIGSDNLGLQTELGAQNFRRLAVRYAGCQVEGGDIITPDGHRCRVRCNPISVNAEAVRATAARPDVCAKAREFAEGVSGRRILLGIDRLDYTKGIDVRLAAYETLLERHPELASEIVMVQIAQPSREAVPEYVEIREEIERRVGHINGLHSDPSQAPIRYLNQSFDFDEVVAYYLAAEVMVVTPLRDGMNLVAKEYAVARGDAGGALVLSEFTGATHELSQWAHNVNPHDKNGIAAALFAALTDPPEEKRERMKAMSEHVRKNTVFDWAKRSLEWE